MVTTLFTSNPGVRGGIVGNKAIDMEVMAPGTTTMDRYIDMMFMETPSFSEESSKNAILGACSPRHRCAFSGVDRERRSEVYREGRSNRAWSKYQQSPGEGVTRLVDLILSTVG